VNGRSALAAFAAHYGRRLAGEGGEPDLAVGVIGEVAGQRGLAGAGIAEQAKHLRRAVGAGLRLQPRGDGAERVILSRRKFGHASFIVHWRQLKKNKNRTLNLPIESMPSAPSRGGACAFAHCPLRRTMFNVATFLRGHLYGS
jgi:hypothetical protein